MTSTPLSSWLLHLGASHLLPEKCLPLTHQELLDKNLLEPQKARARLLIKGQFDLKTILSRFLPPLSGAKLRKTSRVGNSPLVD